MEIFINNILQFFLDFANIIKAFFTNNSSELLDAYNTQVINGTLIAIPYTAYQYIALVIPIVVCLIITYKAIRGLFRLLLGKIWR